MPLSPDLARQVDKMLAQHNRGLVTEEELEDELHAQAVEAAHRAGDPAAAYLLAVAREHPRAQGLAYRVFDSPQWREAQDFVVDVLVAAASTGFDELEQLSGMAYLATSRGVLPPTVREAIKGAPLESMLSSADLIESDREGDRERVGAIVEHSAARGCVSPAVRLLDHRRAEGRVIAAADVASSVGLERLHEAQEFGGMTHLAVQLLADGAVVDAVAWSTGVDDTLLLHADDYSGWALPDDYVARYRREHGPTGCVPLCRDADARLLGALALVDLEGGLQDRARLRARTCDSGADVQGWAAAGVRLIAAWVLSRDLAADELVGQLETMVERSGESHVSLGLLGVQLHSELAHLWADAGDTDRSAHHAAKVERGRTAPEMTLHFEPFQFQPLLLVLPAVRELAS